MNDRAPPFDYRLRHTLRPQLKPDCPTAPERSRLPLLLSRSDGVRGFPSRRAQLSTS